MPRDFDRLLTEENALAPYPADRPGWCDAIQTLERPILRRRGRAASLPESDDLLGWSVLLLTAPGLVIGALILGQAALQLL